jgi:hypothetical protein
VTRTDHNVRDFCYGSWPCGNAGAHKACRTIVLMVAKHKVIVLRELQIRPLPGNMIPLRERLFGVFTQSGSTREGFLAGICCPKYLNELTFPEHELSRSDFRGRPRPCRPGPRPIARLCIGRATEPRPASGRGSRPIRVTVARPPASDLLNKPVHSASTPDLARISSGLEPDRQGVRHRWLRG